MDFFGIESRARRRHNGYTWVDFVANSLLVSWLREFFPLSSNTNSYMWISAAAILVICIILNYRLVSITAPDLLRIKQKWVS